MHTLSQKPIRQEWHHDGFFNLRPAHPTSFRPPDPHAHAYIALYGAMLSMMQCTCSLACQQRSRDHVSLPVVVDRLHYYLLAPSWRLAPLAAPPPRLKSTAPHAQVTDQSLMIYHTVSGKQTTRNTATFRYSIDSRVVLLLYYLWL